jgi:hypothetical protein
MSLYRTRLCGEFAGILQVKMRQRMFCGCMFMIVACEANMRSRLARDPGHNQQAKKHRRLFSSTVVI